MKKMRKLALSILVVTSVVFTSNVLAQDGMEAEKAAAVDAHLNCLRQQTARLDDKVSSADTVGRAIALLCDDYLQATAAYFGPFRSKRSERMFRVMLSKRAPETAAIIVLEGRKKGNSQ